LTNTEQKDKETSSQARQTFAFFDFTAAPAKQSECLESILGQQWIEVSLK